MTNKYTQIAGPYKGANGTTGDYFFKATIEQNSQNIQANTSNITVKLELYGDSNSGTTMWNANVASNQPYGKITGTLAKTGNRIKTYDKSTTPLAIVSYTADVQHEADGTKAISEEFKWVAGGLTYYPASFTIAQAVNIQLDSIARASEIAAENALITDNTGDLTYTITSAASFYHVLQMTFNGTNGTLLNGQLINGTYTGTIPYSDLLTWLGSTTSATLELTLLTYSDAGLTTLVGTTTTTATVVNGIIPPPVDFIRGSMYPRLFPADATDFTTNGITTLADAIKCEITEERNGAFELEMEIATSTPYFERIAVGCLVVAKPNHTQNPQAFEIYEISKPINQRVKIRAHHISYRASYIPVLPFEATGLENTIIGLNDNAEEYNPFIITSDIINTVSRYKQTAPASLRSRLGGSEGSLLDTFGGEYLWDNFTIYLRSNRGEDRGVVLRMGKNITNLTQTLNFENVITGALPIWSDGTNTVVGEVQHSTSAGDYAYARTVVLDLSDKYENAPTTSQLDQAANDYLQNSGYAIPNDNVKVSFVDLADTIEYKDSPLERVNLCDTVSIVYEALNISYKAKVIKIRYDALADRTLEAEVGKPRQTLAQAINGVVQNDTSGGNSGGGGDGTAYILHSWPEERPTSANITPTYEAGMYHFLATSDMTEGKPPGDGHIINFEWDNNDVVGTQLHVQNRADTHYALAVRGGKTDGTWGGWAYADLRRAIWTGSLQNGSSVNLDCSGYTYLRVWVHCYAIIFPVIVDLTTTPKYSRAGATGNTALRGSAIGPVVNTSNTVRTYAAVIELNNTKTTVYARNLGYFSGTTWTAQTSADYYVYRIEAYL